MRKLILVVALVVGLTTFAQGKKGEGRGKDRPNPEEHVEKVVARMTSELSLDTKQQEQVKVLLMDQAKTREAKRAAFKGRRENGDKPSDEEIAQMKKDRADEELATKTQMKKILTEDQYKKWSEIKKEVRKDMKGKMKGRKEGKPVEDK